MRSTALLLAVFAVSYLGFALLAMSQQRHWRLFAGGRPRPPGLALGFRLAGGVAILVGLGLALVRDGAGFGSLLWACAISAAALAVALTLSWRDKRAR